MTIDTKKSAIRIQLRKLIFLFILALFLVFLYTTDLFFEWKFGTDRSDFALGATLLYIIGYTISYLRDANYFYFNNNSSKLIIRYYSLRPLSSEQNSLEIYKSEFYKFEITESFGGVRKNLIIYQRTAKGIAKYSPISISILKKEDVERLKKELSNVV